MGVPDVFLNSSAMARVCIAANIIGSIDVINDSKTEFLFNPTIDLVDKIEKF